MALPWVRLDTQWSSNPKFLMLVEDKKWRAICCYMAGLGYAGVHGTDGFVPAVALPFLHATKREAQELVDVCLWGMVPGGWEVNGWSEFQPATDEAKKRREKAQKAAQTRWANRGVAGKGGDLHAM
jgi:hypothetical protein